MKTYFTKGIYPILNSPNKQEILNNLGCSLEEFNNKYLIVENNERRFIIPKNKKKD